MNKYIMPKQDPQTTTVVIAPKNGGEFLVEESAYAVYVVEGGGPGVELHINSKIDPHPRVLTDRSMHIVEAGWREAYVRFPAQAGKLALQLLLFKTRHVGAVQTSRDDGAFSFGRLVSSAAIIAPAAEVVIASFHAGNEGTTTNGQGANYHVPGEQVSRVGFLEGLVTADGGFTAQAYAHEPGTGGVLLPNNEVLMFAQTAAIALLRGGGSKRTVHLGQGWVDLNGNGAAVGPIGRCRIPQYGLTITVTNTEVFTLNANFTVGYSTLR